MGQERDLAVILVSFPDGYLRCRGHLDTHNAEPVGADGEYMHLRCQAFSVTVVADGEIEHTDGRVGTLDPGVYTVSPEGVTKDGVPFAS
jgi:hypothetical protein